MSTFDESTAYTKNPATALCHDSILSTIGSTPLVKLSPKTAPAGVDIYVKCEAFNPMGSVKDRLALGMIEYAEAHGLLKVRQYEISSDMFIVVIIQ
jgi:cysteine synthase A